LLVAITYAELLGIQTGSDTSSESAIELAYSILGSVEGNLLYSAKLIFPALCRFWGMGIANSSSIMATIGLVRRLGRC